MADLLGASELATAAGTGKRREIGLDLVLLNHQEPILLTFELRQSSEGESRDDTRGAIL